MNWRGFVGPLDPTSPKFIFREVGTTPITGDESRDCPSLLFPGPRQNTRRLPRFALTASSACFWFIKTSKSGRIIFDQGYSALDFVGSCRVLSGSRETAAKRDSSEGVWNEQAV
jgi:hypothetical protein